MGQSGLESPAAQAANFCRGRCLHRPGDPVLLQVSAGGINPSPTTNGGPAANREAATTRTAVGRDALIPPEPALPQTPTGGYGIRPYETARPAANRGAAPSAVSQTSVGDDACIVPQPPRRRKARGRDKSLPYDQRWTCDQPGSRNHPDGRRAGCPHPAGTRAAANTHGRIWNPPLRNGKVRGQPGNSRLPKNKIRFRGTRALAKEGAFFNK